MAWRRLLGESLAGSVGRIPSCLRPAVYFLRRAAFDFHFKLGVQTFFRQAT
jgi:hypothetical protein